MQGIYKIINKVNGKYYVGSSTNIENRWKGHKKELRRGVSTRHLQNAWNKYGEDNFIFGFVETVAVRNNLFIVEQGYLDEGFEAGVLYNIAKRADAPPAPEIGHEVTEKTRAKMSKSHVGLEAWNKGKTEIYSEATLEQMSKSKRGEKNANYGNPCPEEVKARIGKANARPYPAFYNIKTGDFIPAGNNLSELCREYKIGYATLWEVKIGIRAKTRAGWILAE